MTKPGRSGLARLRAALYLIVLGVLVLVLLVSGQVIVGVLLALIYLVVLAHLGLRARARLARERRSET